MGTRYYFTITLYLILNNLHASSCCGSGASSHKLILADNKREFTLSTGFKDNLGETDNNAKAVFNSNKIKDYTFTQSLEYKEQISDRSQIGLTFNYIEKNIYKTGITAKKSGPGDLSFSYNYEVMPDRFYSPYSPRIFSGVRLNYPFGKNLYNSSEQLNVDVIGSGQKSIGTTLVAAKNGWVATLMPTFIPSRNNIPHYWVNVIGLSKSFPFENWTFGSAANWNYTSNKKNIARKIQNWDALLFCNYQLSLQYALGATYTDNTVIGKSINSPLSREIMLQISFFEAL